VLHATVKDRKGRYVTDLSRDAFTVFEDKAPQTISFFASDDAPVTLGLLIDSSGSMQSIQRRGQTGPAVQRSVHE